MCHRHFLAALSVLVLVTLAASDPDDPAGVAYVGTLSRESGLRGGAYQRDFSQRMQQHHARRCIRLTTTSAQSSSSPSPETDSPAYL